MFKKILIANRGEIACRIIKTLKKMNIKSVAVFSEVDQESLHVKLADESFFIGESDSSKSYLDMDKIIEVAKKARVDGIHPGYGFLSENPRFVKKVTDCGINFIGPSSQSVGLMGDKIKSKKIAVEAGIDVIPGYIGSITTVNQALKIAEEIGYPIILKASAGGGGKGMRIVKDRQTCSVSFKHARSEAKSAFGDDRIFLEKYIPNPRHIEIQVVADKHGNMIHLGERECSIQRRYQKIIEEAPSPFVNEKLRKLMGTAALKLTNEVGYFSVGTVEFIVSEDKRFYFLEMNTRIQVEHSVTELITGVDLVELMIKIANNEKLSIKQNKVTFSGWSLEARIYAEDPLRNFLPSVGRLTRFIAPNEDKNTRFDTGVAEGSNISIYYDPMIAKLSVHEKDRLTAIDKLKFGLNNLFIKGIDHNTEFLYSVLSNQQFLKGNLSTNFIKKEWPNGYKKNKITPHDNTFIVIVAAFIHSEFVKRNGLITGQMKLDTNYFESNWVVIVNDISEKVLILPTEREHKIVFKDNEFVLSTNWKIGDYIFSGTVNNQKVIIQIEKQELNYFLTFKGCQLTVSVLGSNNAILQKVMIKKPKEKVSKSLLSPMSGLLISISVKRDSIVKKGDELAVIEAMKMENIIRAEKDGIVSELWFKVGDTISTDQAILLFK